MVYEDFEDLDNFFWTLVTEDDLGLMDNELQVKVARSHLSRSSNARAITAS
jgi:hypothetical protein